MITEKDIELIDQYLANKLAGQSKVSFEDRLLNDAEFNREFLFQKDIVTAIQKARIAELKSVLNKVSVAAGPSTSTILKLTIGVSTVLIVATVTYFLVFQPEKTAESPTVKPQEENPLPSDTTNSTSLPKAESDQKATDQTFTELKPSSKVEPSEAKQKKNKPESQITSEVKEGKAVDPRIEVFDPNSEETQDEEKPTITDKPEEDVFTKSNTLKTDVVYKERKHNFHYQLIGDQLTLIGPFKKELYTVLEFFTKEKRTAFLYFNKTYYSLTATESEKELRPVMDPKLIERLEQYRKQNE